jgi:hypothetical protein
VAVGAAAVVVEVGRPRPAKNRRDTQRPLPGAPTVGVP